MIEYITLPGGKLLGVHSRDKCQGKYCCIHNPSNHHMRDWPLNWRSDRHMMERICPHGIGHPDPDDRAFTKFMYGDADSTHGCDGCCTTKKS